MDRSRSSPHSGKWRDRARQALNFWSGPNHLKIGQELEQAFLEGARFAAELARIRGDDALAREIIAAAQAEAKKT